MKPPCELSLKNILDPVAANKASIKVFTVHRYLVLDGKNLLLGVCDPLLKNTLAAKTFSYLTK